MSFRGVKPFSLSWNHSFIEIKFSQVVGAEITLFHAWANAIDVVYYFMYNIRSLDNDTFNIVFKTETFRVRSVQGDQIVTSAVRLNVVHPLVQ